MTLDKTIQEKKEMSISKWISDKICSYCNVDKKNYQKFKKKVGSLDNIVKLFSDRFHVNEFNNFCNKHEVKLCSTKVIIF